MDPKRVTMAFVARDAGSSAARRKRERRLRSWLRHERMAVRKELTAALHHSASKSAGPEMHDALRSQKTVNSKEDAVFFELYDEDTAGWRPAPLLEQLPQRGVARHLPRSTTHRWWSSMPQCRLKECSNALLPRAVLVSMEAWNSSFLKECSNALLALVQFWSQASGWPGTTRASRTSAATNW